MRMYQLRPRRPFVQTNNGRTLIVSRAASTSNGSEMCEEPEIQPRYCRLPGLEMEGVAC